MFLWRLYFFVCLTVWVEEGLCGGASNKANKWQNKHRQSWFRPLIQCCTDMSSSYSLMMHLPGCFLLTRLFQGYPFYRARWCHCKVFWVSNPRPHLPLQSVSCVLQVYCVLCVCVCEAREEELSNMHSKKKSTFCCCWYFSPKKRQCLPLSRVHDFVLIACEKYIANADQPLSFSRWFLFIAHSLTSGNEDCTMARWCVS